MIFNTVSHSKPVCKPNDIAILLWESESALRARHKQSNVPDMLAAFKRKPLLPNTSYTSFPRLIKFWSFVAKYFDTIPQMAGAMLQMYMLYRHVSGAAPEQTKPQIDRCIGHQETGRALGDVIPMALLLAFLWPGVWKQGCSEMSSMQYWGRMCAHNNLKQRQAC